jgi:hypothetical protein
MRETDNKGSPQEEYVSPTALYRLQEALDRIIKAKHSPHDPVTCSICHQVITLEAKGICADERGHIAHTDCYVQQIISSTKRPVAPEKKA